MIDIPKIERESFFPADCIATIHLRPPGDAGQDFMAPALFWRIAMDVTHQQRPRTDKAHVASKDVPEFRELVEAGAAQEGTKSGDPMFVNHGSGIVCGEHGPKFVEYKGPASEPWSLLAKKNRTSHGDSHAHSNNEHQWQCQYQAQRSDHEVQAALPDWDL